MHRVRARVILLALTDLSLLLGLRAEPAAICRSVANSSPGRLRHWLDTTDADAAAAHLAAAVLWFAAVWLGIGLLAYAGTVLPGVAGRIAARVAHVALPRAVYRVAAGAAGLGVLLAPVEAAAHAADRPTGQTSPAAPITPAPVWPTDDPVATPIWPSASSAGADPAHADAPALPPAPAPRVAGPSRSVVVRPGDSLWRIAAQHLPSSASPQRIAKQWPHWYAANRQVIGPDPDYIVAGQVLAQPHAEENR